MSGRGVAALSTNQKTDPSGAPFVPGSAYNGASVDSTGRIVLGNSVGEAGDPGQLISDREILTNGFLIRLINGGAASDVFTEITNSNYFISRIDFQANFSVVPGLMSINDAVADFPLITLGVSGGPGRQAAISNNNAVLMLGLLGFGTNICQLVLATGNFIVGTLADNGSKLQVDGHISMLSATAALDFPNTAAGTSSDLTIALAGAAVNDMVVLGTPVASVVANGCFTAFVSAAGVVTVRFTNNDLLLPFDPPQGDFTVSIFKRL